MADQHGRALYIPQAGKLDRTIETTHRPPRGVGDGSLTASAQRVTSKSLNPRTQVGRGRSASPTDTTWQEDAWDMYDSLGELAFLTNTLAHRASQARVYVGRIGDDQTDEPEHVDDPRIRAVLSALADSPKQLRQHLARLSAGLRVAGEGWLAGVPSAMMPATLMTATTLDAGELARPVRSVGGITGGTNLDDIEWRALSTAEITFPEEGSVTLALGSGEGETITVRVDDVLLIRVWRPHPRYAAQPDSPVRSLLPALRTLVGLDMRTAAQIDSRLGGAGMMIVPASAQQAARHAAALAAGISPDEVEQDQFTVALMRAMIEPIRDRSSAAALVPIVATVPDEAAGLFNFMDFAKPLDDAAPAMVDQAIRRIALGMDCPPELLLGAGSFNHWGAWLSSIETVRQHIAPDVELICDALTTQYLWPVLMSALGMSEEEARSHVVWYEIEHLIVRPNRTGEAIDLFDRGIIGAAAVRREAGYEESDAPDTPPLPPGAEPAGGASSGEDGAPPLEVGPPAVVAAGIGYRRGAGA